jgi:hypothetical protein
MQLILLSGGYILPPLQHPHHTTKACYLWRRETKSQPAAIQLQTTWFEDTVRNYKRLLLPPISRYTSPIPTGDRLAKYETIKKGK